MGGAILSFCAMAVSIRELSGAHDPFQILFFRSLFGVLVLGRVVARLGPGLLRSPQGRWHAIRHSVHFAAQAGWVYSLALLPLAQVFAIEFTSPVWGSILAVLLLRERFNRGRLLALVAGFAGASWSSCGRGWTRCRRRRWSCWPRPPASASSTC